ncbi:MAG: depolymerase [Deltaproteobacteria bacterium]|nr:depolymerase [Deltaproteobacteria bacterium]
MSWPIQLSLVGSMLLCPAAAGAADQLPASQADPARTSISGLSSGAFMAVQYSVAFSSSTLGVGVVAGGPYNCAYVNAGGIATCLQGAPLAAASYDAAVDFAALGQIDPVGNLAKEHVYLFSGTDDPVVKQSVMDSVRDFYNLAHIPATNLVYVNNVAAGHAFISANAGNLCATTASPYVNQCTVGSGLYDQPAAILTQIYGTLKAKAPAPSAKPIAFDQAEFAASAADMAQTGYVYIPASCQSTAGKGCAVHVVFHGCQQGASEVGDYVYSKLGYNEWADTNNIIVLYPQIDPSAFSANPQGCWDWWGYTGLNFQTQSGVQLSAVRAMVNRLTGQ